MAETVHAESAAVAVAQPGDNTGIDSPSMRANQALEANEAPEANETGEEVRLPPRVSPSPQPASIHRSGLSMLASEDMAEWDALVDGSPQRSLFLKSWWLKAACGQATVLGYFEGGRLIAGIPLYYERRMGLRVCCMPRLTQTLGVVIAPCPGKRATAQSRETEILDVFAARLAQEPIFVQAFHPASDNWLPFHWRGFTQTTHYTYVLDDLTSLDRLWNDLDRDRRNNIRKARRFGLRVRECGPEEVSLASQQSFGRQKRSSPYRLEYLQRLYQAARANDAGICLCAEDWRGRVHAACFFVWDSARGYYLAGGQDPAVSSCEGGVLLRWNLIEFAATRTAVFDFEGSMHRPIEASFRSFGGARVGYHRIVRLPRWLRMGLCALGRSSV